MVFDLRRLMRDRPFPRAVMRGLHYAVHPSRHQEDDGGASVLFLTYHNVRSCERAKFRLQLDGLRRFGAFANLSASLRHLAGGTGRRVCLTFDDGYRGAFDHALPELMEQKIPATFFVVAGWIDEGRADILDWDQCRFLRASGMEIGSHSLTHRRLADLASSEVSRELTISRQRIEAETLNECLHFACPWGQPGIDYNPARDPEIARASGYHSFMTTVQQRARRDDDRMALPRVRMEPGWGTGEIRYAVSR